MNTPPAAGEDREPARVSYSASPSSHGTSAGGNARKHMQHNGNKCVMTGVLGRRRYRTSCAQTRRGVTPPEQRRQLPCRICSVTWVYPCPRAHPGHNGPIDMSTVRKPGGPTTIMKTTADGGS